MARLGLVQLNLDAANPGDDLTLPRIAMDYIGNAVIIWERSTPGFIQIKAANSSNNGLNWAVTSLSLPFAESPFWGAFARPDITMDKIGIDNAVNAVGLWHEYDLGGPPYATIKASHYKEIILKIRGRQEQVNSFLQSELRNKITAAAIGHLGTYKIYKDTGLTQLVDSVTTRNQLVEFFDDHVKKGQTYSYYVTWTDEFGVVEGPVIIKIKN